MSIYQKLLIVMAVGIILVTGCEASGVPNEEVTAVPEAVPSDASVTVPAETPIQPDSTVTTPTPLVEPTRTTPPPVEEGTIEVWQEYANTDYGFRFRYPASWTLVERPNMLALVYRGESITLGIGFKRSGEEVGLEQYGGAAGDFVSRGTINFLGEEIEKEALVFEEVDKEIHYNGTSEISRDGLIFTLAIQSNLDYDAAVIPEEIQVAADEVLATFELIE